jgi:hypothetical protein
MSAVEPELMAKWSKTEALTREELAGLVREVEVMIDMFRSGFNNITGIRVRDEGQRLRILLFNVAAACLEAGYALTLRGYYQPACACARMLLEHLANLVFFDKHPGNVSKALNQEDFKIPVRNALEQDHPDKEAGVRLYKDYVELSRAAHPYRLSRLIGESGNLLRLSAFDKVRAHECLRYLADIGIQVCHWLSAEVQSSGRNRAWVQRFQEIADNWTSRQADRNPQESA